MATLVAVIGSLMFVCSALAGIVARIKRRDVSYWMTLCFLFPPAIAMLFLMPKNTGARRSRESMEAQERRELRGDDGDRIL